MPPTSASSRLVAARAAGIIAGGLLVFIPAVDFPVTFSQPDPSWQPATDRNTDAGAKISGGPLAGEKPPAATLPSRQC